MGSSTREQAVAAYDALREAVTGVQGLTLDGLSSRDWMALAERQEIETRRLGAARHPLLNLLAAHATAEELGDTLDTALANRLRISPTLARRWIADAAELGPRRALTGQPLAPALGACAQAQRDGRIGEEHVRVIRSFWAKIPAWVDLPTREYAEADVTRKARRHRPDELIELAKKVMDCLNPDGNFTDEDRARRRAITLGRQGPDGMSRISGHLTPECRATFEAVQAKLAAPGMCNPDDQQPCVDGAPGEDAVRRDTRGSAQRNHDALNAGLRALLASGDLGQHNGLPTSIIVTTTLSDLEAAAGHGLTGGGTMVPMSDVIRLGRHAHHYLAIFDKGNAVGLYHTKRLASPGQRIVLHAKDRGCTKPGCTVGGYYCEVHHVTPYAQCRSTDINNLTFACGPDHRLLEKGWTTRKNTHHDTEWTPPAHHDYGQPRANTFHHPEKLLQTGDDDEDSA
jgi:Domain of unknown function (DUF222)/HNH endonuclease